jgi:hypothetical protein
MRRTSLWRGSSTVLFLLGAACATDSPPTAPGAASGADDVAGRAFQLTIDVGTGHVTVAPPRVAGQARQATLSGPSFSLVGSEAIQLHAGDCAFTPTPNNSKRKRCTFQLALENRLSLLELVTPTTFPKPPSTTEGLLVFPYTSAGLGLPGGAAVPTNAWDNAPTNFFNDFGGCSAKENDCYRWERYPSPLAGGAMSAPREVGFDIDKAAQSVSAYVVVAADIRDAEPRSLVVQGDPNGCGTAADGGSSANADLGDLRAFITSGNVRTVGLCSFTLPAALEHAALVDATLTLNQSEGPPAFFDAGGRIVADGVSFPLPFFADLILSVTESFPDLGVLSASGGTGTRSVDVTKPILADLATGRTPTQFQLRATGAVDFQVKFSGVTGASTDPTLTIRYFPR